MLYSRGSPDHGDHSVLYESESEPLAGERES